jgi:putative methionine-R-sulfoxide reductase with GAF domain
MLIPPLAPQGSTFPGTHRALWIALLRTAADASIGLLYAVLAYQTGAWQFGVMAAAVGGLVLVDAVAVAWLYRGRAARGGWLLIAGLLPILWLNSALFLDLGIILGLAAVLLTVVTAGQLLPDGQVGRAALAGLVDGVGALLIDLFAPEAYRLALPAAAQIFIPGIAGSLILLFGFLLVRQYRRYSVRTKLVAGFLLVALGPMVSLGLLNDQATRAALTDNANQALLASAAQTATSLDTFINAQLAALRTEAQLPAFTDYLSLPPEQRSGSTLEEKVVATLRALSRKDIVDIVSYALLDASGRNLQDTQTRDIGRNEGDRDYVRAALTNGLPYLSPVRLAGDSNGQATLTFATPVRNARGDIVGVLRVRYNAAVLQQLIVRGRDLAGGSEFEAVLLDENLIRLADSRSPELIFQAVTPLRPERLRVLQAAGRLASGPDAITSTDLPEFESGLRNADAQPTFSAQLAEGRARDSVTVVPLSTQLWVVAFARPQALVLAPVEAQTRNNLLLGVVIAAAVIVAAIWGAQLLTGPITRLTATAAKISAGDLTAQAPIEAGDEIGALATTFNVMTTQLRETLESLEARVAHRTRALATSREVSRRLSTLLSQTQLVREVVEQVRSAFDYYHAQIYLFDDRRDFLVMVGGTGQAGRTLLERSHRIAKGQGLVGRAAQANLPVLVPDVSQAPDWLPNPLLPETRAEIAVPIHIGPQVLGVLDIQHHTVGGLDQDDADLLQSIADQVAIALQNARSYEQTRQRGERERIVHAIGQHIQQAITVESALQTAARDLEAALKASVGVELSTAFITPSEYAPSPRPSPTGRGLGVREKSQRSS